jgi:hypothetical protein
MWFVEAQGGTFSCLSGGDDDGSDRDANPDSLAITLTAALNSSDPDA